MVEVFGAGSTVHFSSKDLGLNARLWDCFRIVRGWIFEDVLGQSIIKILGLFPDSLALDYEMNFRTVHVYSFVCIAKSE